MCTNPGSGHTSPPVPWVRAVAQRRPGTNPGNATRRRRGSPLGCPPLNEGRGRTPATPPSRARGGSRRPPLNEGRGRTPATPSGSCPGSMRQMTAQRRPGTNPGNASTTSCTVCGRRDAQRRPGTNPGNAGHAAARPSRSATYAQRRPGSNPGNADQEGVTMATPPRRSTKAGDEPRQRPPDADARAFERQAIAQRRPGTNPGNAPLDSKHDVVLGINEDTPARNTWSRA